MKPKLLDDVQFVPQPEGVFVMVPSRADTGFRLNGPGTYEWLQRIAPFLTGDHTVDDLLASLDDGLRQRIGSLLALLHREGAVRDAQADLPHSLSPDVRRAYARVIGFIGRGGDSAEHRFQRYRESFPVVVGAGWLATALVQALLVTGVERVRLAPTAERPTDLARLREVLAFTIEPGAEHRVEVADRSTVDYLGTAGGGVLHACEAPMLARGVRLAARCAERGSTFGQATVIGDRALIGPVGAAGQLPPEWARTLWRLAGGGEADPIGDLPRVTVSGYLSGPTAALAANHLCAAFLKQVTGLPTDAGSRFADVDLETLQTGTRPIGTAASRAT